MKNVWLVSLVSILFLLTSCKKEEDKVTEAISSFYSHVYTGNFEEAIKYCTPESRNVITFFKDTYKTDTILLKELSKLEINTQVSNIKIKDQKEATATATVKGLPIFTENVGSNFIIAEEPSVYEVKLYKIDGHWYITADLYGIL